MVVKVPVVLTYSNKGSKQAQKDLNLLGKSIKKFGLASKLSIAGVTASIGLLAKQSVKAAITEEKQAKSLSLTLKNLGKSYAAVGVAEYVNKLQFATGVSEDQLRPALQRLITTTGDVTKSQDLLKLALDISAGSTNSLETVVKALGRAYLGNNTALSRLGLNLTKAELKVATFDQITAKLAETYRGQATEAAKTFGGQLAILGVAADEAKEKIGVSLINAIQELAGDQGVAGVADDMDRLATKTANAITGFTFLIDKVKALGNVAVENGLLPKTPKDSTFFGINPNQPFFGILADIGAQQNALSNAGSPAKPSALGEQRRAIANAKIQVGLNKKAAEEKRRELAAARALAMSAKLRAKFDQENIAIEAALKGKLSDEDRARVLAMKALKSETLTDDEKALNTLNELQAKNAAAELARLKEVDAANKAATANRKSELTALQEWLKNNPLEASVKATWVPYIEGFAPQKPGTPPAVIAAPVVPPATNAAPMNPPATNTAPPNTPLYGGMSPAYGNFANEVNGGITVNVNAGTIADENKLTYIISNELTKFVRFGGITAPAGFI